MTGPAFSGLALLYWGPCLAGAFQDRRRRKP